MSETFTNVVIFDGECPVCSRTAGAIRRIDDVGIISWEDDAAQDFLAAQFDDIPFSLVFIEGQNRRVYVGQDAASVLADRAGMPGLVSAFVGEHYHSMASTLQRTVGRGERPDKIRGEYDLTAVDEFDRLQTQASSVEQLEEALEEPSTEE